MTSESVRVVKCKCGGKLTLMTITNAYFKSAVVHCDLCGKRLKEDLVKIWHCEYGEGNKRHIEGFDMCQQCYHSVEIQYYKDIADKYKKDYIDLKSKFTQNK